MPAPGPRIGWRSETNEAGDNMGDFNKFRSAKLRVAAAQIEPTEADIGDNLQKHFALIHEAGEKGVDLLVFPELSQGTRSSCASARGTRCG